MIYFSTLLTHDRLDIKSESQERLTKYQQHLVRRFQIKNQATRSQSIGETNES